jgi:hypothetical protein
MHLSVLLRTRTAVPPESNNKHGLQHTALSRFKTVSFRRQVSTPCSLKIDLLPASWWEPRQCFNRPAARLFQRLCRESTGAAIHVRGDNFSSLPLLSTAAAFSFIYSAFSRKFALQFPVELQKFGYCFGTLYFPDGFAFSHSTAYAWICNASSSSRNLNSGVIFLRF